MTKEHVSEDIDSRWSAGSLMNNACGALWPDHHTEMCLLDTSCKHKAKKLNRNCSLKSIFFSLRTHWNTFSSLFILKFFQTSSPWQKQRILLKTNHTSDSSRNNSQKNNTSKKANPMPLFFVMYFDSSNWWEAMNLKRFSLVPSTQDFPM